jgi:hypothetical protein
VYHTTTVRFVPRRKNNQLNPVVDGHRLTKCRTRNGSTYYECTLFKDGCKVRITLDEKNNLASTPPTHSHESQVAEIQVHKVKKNLKRKALESDLLTKNLVGEAVGGLDYESRAKLNYGLNAMHKMARLSRDSVPH